MLYNLENPIWASLGLGNPVRASEIQIGLSWARIPRESRSVTGVRKSSEIAFGLPWVSEIQGYPVRASLGLKSSSEIKFGRPGSSEIHRQSRSGFPGILTPFGNPIWASLRFVNPSRTRL